MQRPALADQPPVTETRIRELVEDLRDDDVRFNAGSAVYALQRIGTPAVPHLIPALQSGDYQFRQFAAHVLRRIDPANTDEQLLRVSVEALQDDEYPYGKTQTTFVKNAYSATMYLINHAATAEPLLDVALGSPDHQQRFLAAYILGMGGRAATIERAAPILIAHLRDNSIRGDAILATAALYRFGLAVMPTLQDALADADPQQEEMLGLLMVDLLNPPRTKADLVARKSLQSITTVVYDPAIEARTPYHVFDSYFGSPHGDDCCRSAGRVLR